MIDISKIDYSHLDRPEILMYLFHPRSDWGAEGKDDIPIPVEDGVVIGARFHMLEKTSPNILFFHGNGEIVSDYDELGPLYNRVGINFIAVDYRGYGRSTGKPTVTNMMRDCHTIFEFTKCWLKDNGYPGRFFLMGRSLGSASVLELASNYQNRVDGLIIESGFAYAGPLLALLGIDLKSMDFKEEGFQHIQKIKKIFKPTLIIHAERDHIIPFSDGQALFDACKSDEKTLLRIPDANHNDIFVRGLQPYMDAVKRISSI